MLVNNCLRSTLVVLGGKYTIIKLRGFKHQVFSFVGHPLFCYHKPACAAQEVAWSLVHHDIFVTTPCFQRKVSTLSTFWTPAPTLEAPQVAGADGPLSFDTLTSSSHPRRAASRSAPRPSPSVRQPLSGPGRTASLASALTASSSLQ